ncbi:CAP domain-containing protein [Sorangium sp. So ce131]|uniref:CAP domain-containing protein n=1 Tax=Sorangium sp. So ce131 TaxID=3133282 RepID=UPI003F5ED875
MDDRRRRWPGAPGFGLLAASACALGCGASAGAKEPADGPAGPWAAQEAQGADADAAAGADTDAGAAADTGAGAAADTGAAAGAAAGAKAGGGGAQGAAAPPSAPGKGMTRAEAGRYVLALVNRDRAAHKLPPVVWDETAARAGRGHAEDMVRVGFTGHWGSDGSVPEQRYTGAGGEGFVMENAGCFADAVPRELDPDPRFSAESLERVHHAFMNEKPPADGHRRNVLTKSHTSLGVGLAKAKGLDIACMAQEFVDDYGSYQPLPRRAQVGEVIRVAGEIKAPAKIAGVGLSRVESGKPIPPEKLLRMGGYPIPPPYATFFPKGYKTPIPLEVNGNRFNIQVPLDDQKRPGLYGVSVWATFPGSNELKMISLRTVDVGRKGGAP